MKGVTQFACESAFLVKLQTMSMPNQGSGSHWALLDAVKRDFVMAYYPNYLCLAAHTSRSIWPAVIGQYNVC